MTIRLEETEQKGRAFVEGHQAEMTFNKVGPNLIIIDHTGVDDSLRGQGVGRQLLDQLVSLARERSIKILPLCPYAKSEFDKDMTIADVFYQPRTKRS